VINSFPIETSEEEFKMKVRISKELSDLYEKQHKNFDYAVASALDNFDPVSFITCFKIVNDFELDGKKCEINLGDELAERIVSDLEIDNLDDKTAELLLWIGAVLPEV